MIERLSSDKLSDQRISPSPGSLDPSDNQSSPEDLKKYSPGEIRKRSQSQGKRRSPGSGGHHHSSSHHHRPLANSKSTDAIDLQRDQQQQVSSRHYMSGRERHRRSKDNMLHPPGHKNLHMTRTHSGGPMLSSNHHTPMASMVQPRSLSPPANVGSSGTQELRNRTLSPPPPTSRPPPLPAHAKKQPPNARWSGVSYKSTDSASSEDSLTADLPPRYPRKHGVMHSSAELLQERTRAEPQFFPRAYPPNAQNPAYSLQAQHQEMAKGFNNKPMSSPRINTGQQQQQQDSTHPMDSVVSNAALPPTGSAGNLSANTTQHSRKTSLQGKPVDYSNASHPLQMSVSRGHSQSIGSTLSSYPWHSAHSLPHPQPKQQAAQKR